MLVAGHVMTADEMGQIIDEIFEDDLRAEVTRTGRALDRLGTEGAQDAHDRAGDKLDAFRDLQQREG